ncbi:MAG: hypothetical protein ACR2NU_02045 [Aeoliella sp.]
MKKTLAFLGVSGLAVVIVCAIGIAWLLVEKPKLDAKLTCPRSVIVGETFDLVLETRNRHSDSIILDSIDVDTGFLSGFKIVSITPQPMEPYDIGIIGMRSWGFGESVSPGESLTVTFTLTAVKQGHYKGDVDVCNPNQDFTTVIPNVDILAE